MLATRLALIGLVLGACGKDSACPTAKQTATTALVAAIRASELEAYDLEGDRWSAEGDAKLLAGQRERWTESLSLFEASLGCVAHDDCCARLGKTRGGTRDERHQIEQDSLGVHHLAAPPAIAELQAPLDAVLDQTDVVFTELPNSAAVRTWCKDARAAIAELRTKAAPTWDQLVADANTRTVAAQHALALHPARRATLDAWSTAVLRATAADATAEPADGPAPYQDARAAVARYQAACH